MKILLQNKWIVLAIVVLSLSFYWYELRPALVEKKCAQSVASLIADSKSVSNGTYEEAYLFCVRAGGMDNFLENIK